MGRRGEPRCFGSYKSFLEDYNFPFPFSIILLSRSLGDQSEYAFLLSLVSYWMNALLFPVSRCGGRSSGFNRKTAGVALTL
jgi:hypothetical protein